MKILVAGSKSFLGRNISNYFLGRPDVELVLLSRSNCDLSSSEHFVEYCRESRPDLVIHTAVSLDNTNNNIAMYLALEKASSHYGRAVMIGSGSEYGHQRYIPEMKEDYFDVRYPPINNHSYHLSKHIISRLHQSSYANNIYNFRVFGLYGPYEDYSRRLISNNIYNFCKSGRMMVSANHAFDYLYVEDLISAIEHFVRHPSLPIHQTYNICNGHADRFYEILTEVIVALGGSASEIDIASKVPTDYVYSGDCSQFENEFNYKIFKTSYSQSTLIMKKWLAPIIEEQKTND
jgi:UDP-glucose 4-epimerase